MAASLADLLVERTKDDEYSALRSVLEEKAWPVTDFLPGAAGRSLLEAFAFELAAYSKLLPQLASGGFVPLAKDLKDPTWIRLIAKYVYDLDYVPASSTTQLCRITCAADQGPQTINTGFVIRSPKTGNRYIYLGAPDDVDDDDVLDLEFTAEFPGAKYLDGVDTITEIVTALPGLSVSNPATAFGGIDPTSGAAKKNASNQGSGSITPDPDGEPTKKRSYIITVLSSGAVGAGSIRLAWDEAGVRTTLSTIDPIPASYTVGDDDVDLTFDDGVGVGFIAGDIHTFSTPGMAILVAGADDETNASLANRCLGRWPSLSDNIVADKYETWVRQASIDQGLGIAKVTVKPSPTVAGQADVRVATAAGAPSGGTIAALQEYINARDGICDAGEVKAAVNLDLVLAGTIVVKAADLVDAQAAADDNWRNHVTDLPIGGDVSTGVPGVVRFAELVQAIMDAGAVDHSGLTLNGVAANATLDVDEVAVVDTLPSDLTWVPV